MKLKLSIVLSIAAALWIAAPSLAQSTVSLPAGTRLPLRFETGVSSASSQAGDLVVAQLTSDVRSNGRVAIPAGSEVSGRVSSVRRSGRIKGRAHLAVTFDHITIRGEERPLATTRVSALAPSGTKRDVATLAGGTVGGAVVGGIIGGNKGARIGAASGAAAGTGVVLATKGKDVAFPAGYRRSVRLTRALHVPREITVPEMRRER